MALKKPVDAKVKVGAFTASVAGAILSLLQTYVFGEEVPGLVDQIVTNVVGTFVPGAVAFVAGWFTRNTPVDVEAVRK